MKKMYPILLMTWLIATTGCNTNEPTQDPVTYGETYIPYMLRTDKACYTPGQTVSFTLNNLVPVVGDGYTVTVSSLSC